MTFAASPSGPQLIVLGLLILVTAFVLRRNLKLGKRSRNRDVLTEVRREMREAEAGASVLHNMEIRLHDYGREVEGRVETTLSALDQLILEADQEIDRLQNLLAKKIRDDSPSTWQQQPDIIQTEQNADSLHDFTEDESSDQGKYRPLASQDRHMILCLGQTGFHAEEIADCMNRDEDEVQTILDEARGFGRTDAA